MNQTVRAPCSKCLRTTNHSVLCSDEQRDDWTINTACLVKCMGCDEVSLAKYSRSTDDGSVESQYYPSPIARKQPQWVRDSWLALSKDEQFLADLLKEIYQAVAGKQYRLAAMGIRALVEQLMISTVDDLRTFDEKMDAFQAAGYISSLQRNALAETLEMGHAAMHRAYTPDAGDMSKALDIVEGICATIFEHKSAATALARKVPRREKQ